LEPRYSNLDLPGMPEFPRRKRRNIPPICNIESGYSGPGVDMWKYTRESLMVCGQPGIGWRVTQMGSVVVYCAECAARHGVVDLSPMETL
jgi:hypothetical protein